MSNAEQLKIYQQTDLTHIGKRITEYDNPLEKGVANALYQSKEQRLRRIKYITALIFKHILRGLLFSWPLYLLGIAAFTLPTHYAWILFLIFFIPALWVSFVILKRGIEEDYSRYIKNVILKEMVLKRILWG